MMDPIGHFYLSFLFTVLSRFDFHAIFNNWIKAYMLNPRYALLFNSSPINLFTG